ncbi:MAG: helix-turn-helix domain-containing protein [Acidobacteriota bacterium]
MPRPKGYDPQTFRKAAMMAFWKKGYAATSVADLEEATGLNRRQLFREAKNKRELFLQALLDFAAISTERDLEVLGREAGLASIREVLGHLVDQADYDPGRFGCLVCNTCREPVAADDPEIGRFVAQHLRKIESAYARGLARAASDGEIAVEDEGLRRSSRHLMAIHMSLLLLVRAGEPKAVLEDIAEAAVSSLL